MDNVEKITFLQKIYVESAVTKKQKKVEAPTPINKLFKSVKFE